MILTSETTPGVINVTIRVSAHGPGPTRHKTFKNNELGLRN